MHLHSYVEVADGVYRCEGCSEAPVMVKPAFVCAIRHRKRPDLPVPHKHGLAEWCRANPNRLGLLVRAPKTDEAST